MTIDQQQMLEREMDDALALQDRDRREDAMKTVILHYMKALCDCQRKTSERVKELVAERSAAKLKLEGMQLAWRVFRYVAAAGGGAAVLKLFGGAS